LTDTRSGGGTGAYAVYNDGLDVTVSTDGASPSTTAPSTTGGSSATVVQVASTVFVTAPGSTSAQVVYTTQSASPSGPNKGAIAAGVIVAVVVVCAVVGGIMLWMRQRRRRELEEEHRRKEAEKPQPHGNSTTSLTDARLEPSVMFQRRQSDGSIADNQDYSRRILKVCYSPVFHAYVPNSSRSQTLTVETHESSKPPSASIALSTSLPIDLATSSS
jgi:cell wall integrity and stress response component